MKLEAGMYVRLHGKIGKIEHICMCEQCKLRGFYEPVVDFGHNDSDYVSIYWKDDLKASHNIIDLIEVGDYVNGVLVESIYSREEDKMCFHTFGTEIMIEVTKENINNIVTKEQFESMSYKIGD